MSAPTTTTTVAADVDPIDVLVPPPHPWWIRLVLATAVVLVVGCCGYLWHFGVLRPMPDCCGSSSSSTALGQSDQPDAVTAVARFFNSSRRPIIVTGATAVLPGATVVDIAPFRSGNSYELPPVSLAQFPIVIEPYADMRFAVTFAPTSCDDSNAGQDWGELSLDLEVAGDPWYPTLSRSFDIPVVESGPDQLTIFAAEEFDDFRFDSSRPLSVACTLLGR